jgi:hypothetical protein
LVVVVVVNSAEEFVTVVLDEEHSMPQQLEHQL